MCSCPWISSSAGAPAAAGIELVQAGVIAEGGVEVLEVRLRANEAFAAPILLIEGDRGVLYPRADLEISEDGHAAAGDGGDWTELRRTGLSV